MEYKKLYKSWLNDFNRRYKESKKQAQKYQVRYLW
jgi:hypothetical protein